jgi:hypothetical protein
VRDARRIFAIYGDGGMNRAPVALFALLCTLASSMVAAGVADDRYSKSINLRTPALAGIPLKTVSFVGSSKEKWLTSTDWQAIDIRRAVTMPSSKLPTDERSVKAPAVNQHVSAIIITIQQAPATKTPVAKVVETKASAVKNVPAAKVVASKPVEKEPKSALTAPKAVAASKQVTKPAVAPKFDLKSSVAKVTAVAAEADKKLAKAPIATKVAAVQPRVTSKVSVTYAAKYQPTNLLGSRTITLADLHFYVPTTIINTGLKLPSLAAQQQVAGRPTKITLQGEKLKFDVKPFASITGTSFIATPYIANDAASILVSKVSAPTKSAPAATKASTKAATVPSLKKSAQWSTVGGAITTITKLQSLFVQAYGNAARQVGLQFNQVAGHSLSRLRSYSVEVASLNNTSKTIKSAQLKAGQKSGIKK